MTTFARMFSPNLFLLLVGALCFLIVEVVLMMLKWIGVLGLGWGWIMAIAITSAMAYALIVNEVFDP